jgi:peptidoglycan-associated lipoprotein
MRGKLLSYAIVVTLIGTLGLTGCKNLWKKKSGGTETQPSPLGEGTGIPAGPRPPIGMGTEFNRSQFAPVHFDFDSAKIRPSEVGKLEAVASWMKSNPGAKLVVEGHCDERGTAEYNRALGERRAQAAREKLVALGVDASRITTISYGKDRPADLGHSEAAWAKNRRCEFATVKE